MSAPAGLFLSHNPSAKAMENTLDVGSTLARANAVLQTHREKMKRRSTSISPLSLPPSSPHDPPPPPSLLSSWTEDADEEGIEELSLATAPQKGVAKRGGRGRVVPIQSVWENKDDVVDTPTELFVSYAKEDEEPPPTFDNGITNPASTMQDTPSEKTTPPQSHDVRPSDILEPVLSPFLPFSPSIPRLNAPTTTKSSNDSNKENMSSTISPPQVAPPPHAPPPISEPKAGDEDEEEMTESELLEYHSFLKKLKSESSGRVVTVAPAPADKRSSYHKHGRSKVGVDNIVAMTTSTGTLNGESRPSSACSNLSSVGEKEPIRMVRVLPVDCPGKGRGAIVRRGDDNNKVKKKEEEKEKEENDDFKQSSVTAKSNDIVIEDTNEWIPPTDDQRPLTPSLPPSLPPSLSPSSHRKGDITIEECDNEDDLSSSLDARSPESQFIRNGSQSTARNGSQSTARNESQSTAKNESQSTARNGSQSTARNGSQSIARNESQSGRNGYESTTNLNSVSSDLTLVDVSEEKDEEEEEEEKVQNDTQTIKVTSSERDGNKHTRKGEGLHEDNGREEEEEEEDEVGPMPLLRVKSTTSLYVPDYEFQSKRKRATPAYTLHSQANSTTLGPPCPLYGVTQPTEDEITKMSLRQFRASTSKENEKGNSEKRINEERAVVKGREKREVATTLSSSSSLSSLSQSLNYYYDKEVESDLSLHKAASEGNHRMLQQLLSKGYSVNGIDGEGVTPLMYCVLPSGGVQLACADLLIRKGANVDQQAIDGSTALHSAAVVGSVSFIELLLLNGANPDIRDRDGRLPLHWATASPSTKALEILLKDSQHNADVTDGGDMTPLMWSCYNKNESIARRLIELGADVHEKDADGRTAAHWAARKCDIDLFKLILRPDMTYFKDIAGCTVMHISASEGFICGIQHILMLRPDSVHDTDKMGRTPLHYAAAMDRVDICYLLLNKGADASQRDLEKKTPLDYALMKQNEFVVALFTCHDTSVGDFIRLQRSESDNCSIYSDTAGSLVSESVSFIAPSDYTTATHHNVSSRINRGHYLGYFVPEDNQSPPLHYYFWIKRSKLYWSRSIKKHNRREGVVLSVIPEASQRIKERDDYSPTDLHLFAFCVITERELLDLLAYSQDSYNYWIQSLQSLSVQEREEEEEEEEMEDKDFVDEKMINTDGSMAAPAPLYSSTPLSNGQPRQLYPNNVI